MAYTTIKKPSDYFNTKLYTGNGTAIGSGGLAVTGVGFQPDWVWLKNRTTADRSHQVYDVIRGVTKGLKTNSADAENTSSERLTAFGSDGFTVGNNGDVNTSGNAHVSWNWKAGTSFTNDASATGIGTIDSTGSVNDTAGFSIVSYTGTGSAGTIKHGLSSVPYMMIIKKRNSATGSNWMVYHKSISGTGDGHLWLDLTNAKSTDTNSWNNTAPTSSVFSIGTRSENNGSGDTFIAYCFAEKQGYSKFGSYVGNGNVDGSFVYLGFKPAWVMIKRTDSSTGGYWVMFDNKRNTFNVMDKYLFAQASDSEDTSNLIDFYSNGFRPIVSNLMHNGSGASYIYMAFAEQPLVGDNPATAR